MLDGLIPIWDFRLPECKKGKERAKEKNWAKCQSVVTIERNIDYRIGNDQWRLRAGYICIQPSIESGWPDRRDGPARPQSLTVLVESPCRQQQKSVAFDGSTFQPHPIPPHAVSHPERDRPRKKERWPALRFLPDIFHSIYSISRFLLFLFSNQSLFFFDQVQHISRDPEGIGKMANNN